MTSLATEPTSSGRTSPDRTPSRWLTASGAVLPWLAVVVVAVLCLVHGDVPWSDAVAYVLAWVVGSTVPGVLVWRAVAGGAGPPPALRGRAVAGRSPSALELGFGAVPAIAL